MELIHGDLTHEILGSAIEVHKGLGPGLLESTYEGALCHELTSRGITFDRQVALPMFYKDVRLDFGYRIDLVVQSLVVVEIKCVEEILEVHKAQLLTYMKLTGLRVGLLINFNVAFLPQGIVRRVL